MYKKYYYNFYVFEEIFDKDENFESEHIRDYLKIRKQECEDLKFVINFSWDNLLDKDTYSRIDEMLDILGRYGIQKEDIVIGVNKENHRFNSKEWKLILAVDKKFKEMGIEFGFEDMNKTFSVAEVENANAKINQTVDKIRKERLSPFECLLAGYLTVTSRKYIEEDENKHASISRSVFSILNNEEIVCTGFAEYLKAIIEKVGSENIKVYNNSVATSTDNKYIDEYHSNLIVYIKDEKYGIDGYYYLDPTWDAYDENEVPNLEYFMVPLSDIDHIKIDNIRSENALPPRPLSKEEREKQAQEDVDVIYDDKELNEVSFTSDALEFSTEFVDDFLESNPLMLNKLKAVVQKRNFIQDYERMEKLEIIVDAEKEAMEMFEGNNIDTISDELFIIFRNALSKLELSNIGKDEFLEMVGSIIEKHYLQLLDDKKIMSLQREIKVLLEKNIKIYTERLTSVQRLKAEYISDEEIYDSIMTDIDLLGVVSKEVRSKSIPIHIGKTMDALRVVYTKMNPDILPKLVDQRVKETINHNIKLSKRHFTKKSQSAFLELYNLEKHDKQK